MTTAHLDSICAACKRPWPIELAQHISNQHLSWTERFACECGHGFEARGVGLPTPGIRRALLAQLGHAQAWVDAMKSKPPVVKTLATITGEAERAVAKSLQKVPAMSYEGTPAEAEFVAQALRRAGATVRVLTASARKRRPKKRTSRKR